MQNNHQALSTLIRTFRLFEFQLASPEDDFAQRVWSWRILAIRVLCTPAEVQEIYATGKPLGLRPWRMFRIADFEAVTGNGPISTPTSTSSTGIAAAENVDTIQRANLPRAAQHVARDLVG
jgi:hypothetical protein